MISCEAQTQIDQRHSGRDDAGCPYSDGTPRGPFSLALWTQIARR
jgi:hypothetical protein